MAILKFFHLLFVFLWVGTLLTLTRILRYMGKEEEGVQKRIAALLKRLYLFVDFPSMLLAIIFGIALLILKNVNLKAPWLHMKLTFAFFLIICDLITGWKIVRHLHRPFRGRGSLFLHLITLFIFILILIAIYIFKATYPC